MATYWENSCSFGLRYVSWYKYLIVSLVFSHLGFWSGNLFLIAPFPDLCLLVPFCIIMMIVLTTTCTFIVVRKPQNKVRIKSGPSGLVFYWYSVLIAHDLYLLININICKCVLKE